MSRQYDGIPAAHSMKGVKIRDVVETQTCVRQWEWMFGSGFMKHLPKEPLSQGKCSNLPLKHNLICGFISVTTY